MSRFKKDGLKEMDVSRSKSDVRPMHIPNSESREELSKELLDAAKKIDVIAYQYSFDNVRSQGFGGKSPVFWFFDGKKYALEGNWRKILMSTCEALNDLDHDVLANAVEEYAPNYFALSSEGMRDPYFHAPSGVWIDKALSATDIIFQDVIVVDLVDKAYALKLLEHVYLPEDFGATTLLVPQGVSDVTDGVEYMLEIYKERYGQGATAEGAFIFLKENNVRANFVGSLKKTIMEFLGRSAI